MGSFFSTIKKIFGSFKHETRIIMIGLDAAGKTSLLNKFRFGQDSATIPTIGFNVEHIEYKNLTMTIWDVGGQSKIRSLWKHYYQNTDAVIFVVDSTDEDRFDEAAEHLHAAMRDDNLRNAPFLIFSNKMDLPNSHSVSKVAEALKLSSYKNKWFIQGCSVLKNEGIIEGMEYLVAEVNKSIKNL